MSVLKKNLDVIQKNIEKAAGKVAHLNSGLEQEISFVATTRKTEMLQKARQEKHESHSSILARWNNDYKYRDSLSRLGLTEQEIMLTDKIALENRSCVATRAERIQNSTH